MGSFLAEDFHIDLLKTSEEQEKKHDPSWIERHVLACPEKSLSRLLSCRLPNPLFFVCCHYLCFQLWSSILLIRKVILPVKEIDK